MGVSLKAKEHTCCATSTDTIVRFLWKRQQANRTFHVAMLKGMSRSGTPALVGGAEGKEVCAAEIFSAFSKSLTLD